MSSGVNIISSNTLEVAKPKKVRVKPDTIANQIDVWTAFLISDVFLEPYRLAITTLVPTAKPLN